MPDVIERLSGRVPRAVVRFRRTAALAAVLLCLAQATAAGAQDAPRDGVRWTVLESTPEMLRVRVDVSGESAVQIPDPDGSRTWTSLRIPGAPAGAAPGEPSLPRAARWVALPPEGAATVRVDRL